ncbi:MAG: sensor histidine kinase [Bacteroidetes bacterium]|nr:sensor histidine kinase [Bacteroidota bacterium]
MRYYHCIALLLFSLLTASVRSQPEERLAKLHASMDQARSDTARAHLLSDAVWDIQVREPALADSIATLGIRYAERSGDDRYIATAYSDAGVVKYRLGDFAACEKDHLHALELRRKLNDEKGIGANLGNLGALYQKKGDLDKALQYQLECLRIQEKNNNQLNIALTYNNIAVIHSNQKNYHKAIDYAQKALVINYRLPNPHGLITNYNTLSGAYMGLKDYDSARMLLDSVVSLSGAIGDKFSRASALSNIGSIYERRGDSARALTYFEEALTLATEVHNKAAIGMYSQNVGSIYEVHGQYDKAEPYLLTAYETAKSLDQKPVLYLACMSLYQVYKHKGDMTKAARYVEESITVKDSVFNAESSRQIAEMQTKYDTEKKEQEIQIQRLKLNRRNIILIVMSIVFLLSAIIGWLGYNRYKMRQKVLLQDEILRQQQIRARAVLEAEEAERQRIGRDLHDGVGQLLSATKLNLSGLEASMTASDLRGHDVLQSAMALLDESVREVRSISHSMMPNVLIKSGLVSAVRDFVNKMNTSNLKIDLDIVGMNQRLDTTAEAVMYRVFQEIINNTIRHSGANHVTIQLLRHEYELVLMVEDNGGGFDVAKVLSDENGIGIKNIRSRIEYLHGTVNFDSAPGKGTTVTVEIPLNNETDHS